MRLPEFRDTVLREFRDTVESQEIDPDVIRKGVEIALRGQWFDVEEELLDFSMDSADVDGATQWQAMGERGGRRAQSFGFEKQEQLGVDRKNTLSRRKDVMFSGRSLGGALGGGAFFRELDSTKQWAESQWDRIRTVGGPAPATHCGQSVLGRCRDA